ncbi:hypothetical protein MOSE0_M12222 [Monosporozyma servazzii]
MVFYYLYSLSFYYYTSGYIEVVSFELPFFFPCRQAIDFTTRQLLLTTIECFFPLSSIYLELSPTREKKFTRL